MKAHIWNKWNNKYRLREGGGGQKCQVHRRTQNKRWLFSPLKCICLLRTTYFSLKHPVPSFGEFTLNMRKCRVFHSFQLYTTELYSCYRYTVITSYFITLYWEIQAFFYRYTFRNGVPLETLLLDKWTDVDIRNTWLFLYLSTSSVHRPYTSVSNDIK